MLDVSAGDRKRTVRLPDGTETQMLTGTDGRIKITEADSTVIDLLQGPDPRFGMQSPVSQSVQITTAGLTANLTNTVTANLADANNPLSLIQLTQTTTLNGRHSTRVYEAASRRTTFTSAAGRTRYTLMDAKGRVVEAGVAGLEPVHYRYDSHGLLAEVRQGTDAEERVALFSYNASGYLDTLTDPLGHTTALSYDPAGRVLTQTLAMGEVIHFRYDLNGNLTTLAPPGRPAHAFTYNPVDQVAAYTPPDIGIGNTSTTYAYNLDRQLTQVTRPDGATLSYAFDPAGRLSSLTISEGPYHYAYNSVGQLASITAPSGTTLDYSYSGALLSGLTWTGSVQGRVDFGYDSDFRLSEIRVNDSNPVSYQYDADSLLTGVGELTLSRHAQHGLLTGTTLGTVSDSFSYNHFGELIGYSATHSGSPLLAVTYTRDKLGRISQKVETVNGLTTTYDYTYDALSRLVEVKHNGVTTAAYSYDANGNRLSKTTGGSTLSGTYDAQDRLLSYGEAAYTYTANGELQTKTIGGQTTAYRYDALGNLLSVDLPGGSRIEYVIDGQNRRVGKKVNGVLVQGFLYQDQLKPVAELDGSGQVIAQFVYADKGNVPAYLIKGGHTYRILSDYLGSPRRVVDTTTGAVAQQMDYDEFGNVLTDTNPGFQPFGFAGGLYDLDSRLIRFGARDYDAQIGRWVLKDPVRFDGDGTNFYEYVLNDPINWNDSEGLFIIAAPAIPAVAAIARGVITAIVIGLGAATPVTPKDSDIVYNQNKDTRKKIKGLQDQVDEHKEKLRNNPDSRDRKHWEKEIEAWEERIKRLRKRLPGGCE